MLKSLVNDYCYSSRFHFHRGPDKEGYHIGKMNNFMEVFGDEKRFWLLPISTYMGDGISYPTRINTLTSYNSMSPANVNNSNNAKLGEWENERYSRTM